jgi:hypothetical protein
MNLESIRLIRNVLLKTLAITFVLNLLMAAATFGLWDTWTGLTSQWFHTSPESLGPLMVNFFTLTKFFAIYVLLGPALALHWTLKTEARKSA